jgi:hypothetical protein
MRRPFPLTIDWAGAPDFPEVDEGSGTIISRVDWTAPTTVIENVVTGSGNDRIFDDPNANTNNSMNGSPGCEFFIGNGGNYTYNGGTGLEGCFGLYADEFTDFGGPPPRSSDTYVFPRVFGHDGMIDIHGTADLVDLSAYSTTDLASATPPRPPDHSGDLRDPWLHAWV